MKRVKSLKNPKSRRNLKNHKRAKNLNGVTATIVTNPKVGKARDLDQDRIKGTLLSLGLGRSQKSANDCKILSSELRQFKLNNQMHVFQCSRSYFSF